MRFCCSVHVRYGTASISVHIFDFYWIARHTNSISKNVYNLVDCWVYWKTAKFQTVSEFYMEVLLTTHFSLVDGELTRMNRTIKTEVFSLTAFFTDTRTSRSMILTELIWFDSNFIFSRSFSLSVSEILAFFFLPHRKRFLQIKNKYHHKQKLDRCLR